MTQEQYDRVCKGEFDRIHRKLDDIADSQSNQHNRLFVDNGAPCVQTRLDRNDRMWKIMIFVLTVVCVASIAQIARDIVSHYGSHGTVSAEK